ncbi:nucleotide-binding protein [Desulfatitalea tepidiphila]|uniref:nucleotide-binding protein n=1 Tax=Desulfatitalea tepidiphila TaxID=1185843 RepID=UPI0006B4B5F6|nr:ATP-binding protein [Desulfatitalea tepidiphila]
MKIAIASGKGGTGKTMVTASLSASWGRPVVAVDLDVEEPNLHLFLKPDITGSRDALMEVPQVDTSKCDYCRKCAEFCEYKAISVLGDVIMIFPEMCHGCGGCLALCPTGALTPAHRKLGEVSWGTSGENRFLMGRLRVGEAMSPPLIHQVMTELKRPEVSADLTDVLIDAPPGVSCPAISAVIDSDFVVLVTEPTPFGVFDLRLAHQAFTTLGKPMGVVVNRAGVGNDEVYRFCSQAGLSILAEIPYDRAIAEAYAAGNVIARTSASMTALFQRLAETIRQAAAPAKEARHA